MTQDQVDALADALRKHFGGEVEAEPVNGHGRYRFSIVSSGFAQMTHLQRQDAIWKIVDQVLARDATLDVSMILAFAPAELLPAD